jgi:hypothetical protein
MAQCTAMAASTRERCQRAATAGTNVCTTHGALAPQVKAAAARRLAEARAREAISRMDIDIRPGQDPLTAMESALAETLALKDRLRAVVATLEDDQLRYAGRAGEQLRGEISAYMALLKDVSRQAESMIKLDISERRVRIEEAQALLLVGVIKNVLSDLDLTPEQKRVAGRSVSVRLREVTDGRDSEDRPEPYTSPRRSPAPSSRTR